MRVITYYLLLGYQITFLSKFAASIIFILVIVGLSSCAGNHSSQDREVVKRDGDYLPIVRYDPIYPQAAASNGIEGWVELSFTVLSSGRVSSVKVVNRYPKDTRVFDEASIAAVQKWLYKPRAVNGEAVDAKGATTKLSYQLSKAQ